MSEDLLEALLEPINVVVDQVLAMDLALINEADEGEALVDLAQVEYDVLLVVSVRESDDRARLLVELRAVLLIVPVDAGDVDQHVNELRAYLVVLHVHRRRVRGDIHLRYDIEEERLLDLRSVDEHVHHLRNEGDLRQQLLHDFGQGDVDGVVVNARQLERKRDRVSELREQASHVRLNRIEALDLLVIIIKHI